MRAPRAPVARGQWFIRPWTARSAISAALQSGYATGAWNGPGINSSSGVSASSTLGYGEAGSLYSTFPATFPGQTMDGTTIVCHYTVVGDANLDRAVDTTDFNLLVADFGQTGKTFSHGDFNYNGAVDTVDFNVVAGQFSKTLTPGQAAASALPE